MRPPWSSSSAARERPDIKTAASTLEPLNPLIHEPARLRILVTLAALNPGDQITFTRLQKMLGLTPGNLITHLRKLENGGYVKTVKTGHGVWSRTTEELTRRGRQALDAYTEELRNLLGGLAP